MHAGGKAEIVSQRIAGHGISDAGVRGVGDRPRHIGKIRLHVRATAGRGLSDEGGELLRISRSRETVIGGAAGRRNIESVDKAIARVGGVAAARAACDGERYADCE
jgi:hypothetical protein